MTSTVPAVDAGERPRSNSAERRRSWRDRNRLAVVDALLDLIDEGNLRPGAHEIAERSGVSRRSVFRYFDDMEDLHRMAIVRSGDRVREHIRITGYQKGTLEERIDGLARQRVRLFSSICQIARVARLMAPFHEIIAEQVERSRSYYARQVEDQFAPELAGLADDARARVLQGAQALCSFEAWEFLSSRGVEDQQYADALRHNLQAMFRPG